jgi:transcriptional regulator with XRE-family HTH domain
MDLREARFKNRISQWELSRLAMVHQSRISLIENGHPARDEEKNRIAKALKIDPLDIQWPNNGNQSS